MDKKKQTVYVPTKMNDLSPEDVYWEESSSLVALKESGYFFTPSELEEYVADKLAARDKHWEFQCKIVARDAAEKAITHTLDNRLLKYSDGSSKIGEYLDTNHPLPNK